VSILIKTVWLDRGCSGDKRSEFRSGNVAYLRDARVLRDALLNHSDWDTAGHLYAEQHDSYFTHAIR